MPVIRTDHKAGFTVVDNGIFKGKLSFKACGLLCTLMSFPDGWRFSECGLEAMLEKDGRASIRSAIKELEAAGYLTRKRIRKEGKVWESEWTFSDRPLGAWSEKPALEKPMLENRTTNKSTEVLNKEVLNKNQSSTEQCDIPTSLDEVKQFFEANKLAGDAEDFYQYNTMKHWTDSYGNPIKNWQAFARKWKATAEFHGASACMQEERSAIAEKPTKKILSIEWVMKHYKVTKDFAQGMIAHGLY